MGNRRLACSYLWRRHLARFRDPLWRIASAENWNLIEMNPFASCEFLAVYSSAWKTEVLKLVARSIICVNLIQPGKVVPGAAALWERCGSVWLLNVNSYATTTGVLHVSFLLWNVQGKGR